MKRRDKDKNRREVAHAFSMILQIGLAMMICMAVSIGIGYYIDRLFHTNFWMVIMLFIGMLASLRSMLILTGVYRPGEKKEKKEKESEGTHEDSQD